MVNVASFTSEKTSIEKILDNFDNTTVFYLGILFITQHPRRYNMLNLEEEPRLSYPMPRHRPGVSGFVFSKQLLWSIRRDYMRCHLEK